MTDRIVTLTVHIKATREDDVGPLMAAIQRLRGVLDVHKGTVADSRYHMGAVQMDLAWRDHLLGMVRDNSAPTLAREGER